MEMNKELFVATRLNDDKSKLKRTTEELPCKEGSGRYQRLPQVAWRVSSNNQARLGCLKEQKLRLRRHRKSSSGYGYSNRVVKSEFEISSLSR